MASNNYYPQQVGSLAPHDLWLEFKIAYDLIYSLQAKIRDLESKLGQSQTSTQPAAGGPINTTINGLFVKPTTPTNGQKLTFVSASGQIEWQ